MPAADPTEMLLRSGERLPSIVRLLVDEIWSPAKYAEADLAAYLKRGESAVKHLEELISLAAPRIWDELAAQSEAKSAPSPRKWLGLDEPLSLPAPRAVVVFDGRSLRELPLLLKLAVESGMQVAEAKAVATVLPTETIAFVKDRVLGTRESPSRLPGRRDLRDRNVAAFYLDQPNSREIYPADHHLLIWSSYPDRLYSDDSARSDALFEQFHELIPTIWKYTVQAVPAGMPIVVTSDHGYIYFGAGMESNRSSDAPAILGQKRCRSFEDGEPLPSRHPDLQIVPRKKLAMLRGRLKTRAPGGGSRRRYQHDGFSLMEVLVPWVELHRNPS